MHGTGLGFQNLEMSVILEHVTEVIMLRIFIVVLY